MSWNLNIDFPEPCQSFLSVLSFLNIDVLDMRCFIPDATFLTRVLLSSFLPVAFVIVSYIVYLIRSRLETRSLKNLRSKGRAWQNDNPMMNETQSRRLSEVEVKTNLDHHHAARQESLKAQHATFVLLLSYLGKSEMVMFAN